MLDRDTVLSIAHDAVAASKADQTEVLIAAQDSGLTRFANSVIHQNVHESDISVKMRAVVGTRIGVATTNDTSAESLADLARRALEVARNSAPNDEFVGLPAPGPKPVPCDLAPMQATVDCGPSGRAALVREMLAIADEQKLSAAGLLTTGAEAVCVANSPGISTYYARSEAAGSVLMQAHNSSGFAQAQNQDVSLLATNDMARIAADKAIGSADPGQVDPGKYTVILEPLAATDMLAMLAMYDLNALAHQEGRSFTTGKIGQKVCGDNISIWDDGWDARGSRIPFDFEGIPKQKVDIIKDGVLLGVTYDSFTAGREEGATNTGHALPAPNTWGPVPLNLFMNTGRHSIQDMVDQTEHGVLVTRLHYTNMVHPVRTVFTGMTRDGTFLIRDGKVVGGLKNMRFTQSILEALSNVDMIGAHGAQSDYAWAPALRIQGFEFSSATEF